MLKLSEDQQEQLLLLRRTHLQTLRSLYVNRQDLNLEVGGRRMVGAGLLNLFMCKRTAQSLRQSRYLHAPWYGHWSPSAGGARAMGSPPTAAPGQALCSSLKHLLLPRRRPWR